MRQLADVFFQPSVLCLVLCGEIFFLDVLSPVAKRDHRSFEHSKEGAADALTLFDDSQNNHD